MLECPQGEGRLNAIPLSMDYYISRDQKTYGPYSGTEIKDHLESGALSPLDHAWRDGEAEWRPLGELMDSGAGANAPQSEASPGEAEQPSAKEPSPQERETPQSSSGGRERRGGFRAGRFLATVLGILLLGYLASPYLCLILLNRALGSGDVTMIERLVDFPALREGLVGEAAAVRQNPKLAIRHAPYLGVEPEALPVAVEYIGQRYLTPSGLSSLLARPELATRERAAGTFASMTAQAIDPSRLHWAFLTGPTEFVADLDGLKLIFRVSGGFWRLEHISFL